MSELKHKLLIICIMGLLFGAGISVAFINPYFGSITLSEMLLQISGSRGEFPLGFNLPQLLALSMRLIPSFVFELYVGTELYHYFCTASVYIFSRTPKRLRWYKKEILVIVLLAIIYELTLLVGETLVTTLRYQVEFDKAGLVLCVYHIILYTLWISALTVLVNLAAILLDSSTSFMMLIGAQLVMITLLSLLRLFENNGELIERLICLNPISHLILGWHSSHINTLHLVLHPPYGGLYLCGSLLFIGLFCIACVALGAFHIVRYDLLISNSEVGVF